VEFLFDFSKMNFTEVSYKVNTMGDRIFSNKLIGLNPDEITLWDFKNMFANRHHVSTDNFR
jgi:lipopolysaccharide/colanic/teichoic acid biosynthesis glycosyltransferase